MAASRVLRVRVPYTLHQTPDITGCPSLHDSVLVQLLLNAVVPEKRSGSIGNVGWLREAVSKGSSWLYPLENLEERDKAILMDTAEFLFADRDRCLIYCDTFEVILGSDHWIHFVCAASVLA